MLLPLDDRARTIAVGVQYRSAPLILHPHYSSSRLSVQLASPMKRRRDGSTVRPSKWQLATTFVPLVFSIQQVVARPFVYVGNATTFDVRNFTTAGCGLMSWPAFATSHYAGLLGTQIQNATLMNSTWAASACGRCVRVWCMDDQRCDSTANGDGVVAYVVQDDRRQWNATLDQDLNLSPTVMQSLTGADSGRVPVRWQFTQCPAFSGNHLYEASDDAVSCSVCVQKGSNPYWLALQPVNDSLGVVSVKLDRKFAARPVSSASYFFTSVDWRGRFNLMRIEVLILTKSRRRFKREVSLRPGSCFDLRRSDEVTRSPSGGGGVGAETPTPGGTHGSPDDIPSSVHSEDDPLPDIADAETDEDGVFDDLAPPAGPNSDEDSSSEVFVVVTTAPPALSRQPIASPPPTASLPPSIDVPSVAPATPASSLHLTRTVIPPPSPGATPHLPGLYPSNAPPTPTSALSHQSSHTATPPPSTSFTPRATQTLTPIPSPVDKGVGRPTEDPADSGHFGSGAGSPSKTPRPSSGTPASPIPTISSTPVGQLSSGVLTSPVFVGVLLGTVGLVGAIVAYRARASQRQRLALAAPATSRAPYARGTTTTLPDDLASL